MKAPERGSPWRRFVGALDEPSETTWLAGAVHHGIRVLLLIATALAVYAFFPAPRVPDAAVLERGVVSPRQVIAEIDFTIPKSEAELLQERAEAASGVPPVFARDPAAADSMIADVRTFFMDVGAIRSSLSGEEERAAVRDYLEGQRISPTVATVTILTDRQRSAELQRSIESAVRALSPRGTISSTSAREPFAAAQIRERDGDEQLVPRDSLLSPDRFFSLANEHLPVDAGASLSELQRLLLIRFHQPSLRLDVVATEAARARARAAVDPVKATVLRGERIVGAHEQIGEREEERLRAYQAALSDRGMDEDTTQVRSRAFGSVLFNILVLGIFGMMLLLFRRPAYQDFRSVTVLAVLIVAVAGAAATVARFELPPELIPVTFAALIVAVLWDERLALVLALVIALLLGGQSPFLGVAAPFAIAIGGSAAAFGVRIVSRRSRTWVFISVISLAYAAAAVAMGLMRARPALEVLEVVGWGTANAIVASLLAIGFVPLLEALTRVTTDQTLLELSDTNRPLLRRLQREANGTFHHTINVANLAEAACHAIGANGLLARVGAYYHDLGKLVKPQYFVENQPRGRNPHDKLKPTMSAAIIRSHITEGLRLAGEARLPDPVRAFIAEHHGTQRISFFYDRAREADPDGPLNPADFTYPGPKPQTRETAIVMLADSVESAARVLQDPSAARIRELVERIVAGKISGGQLDQSPLTLREIELVKDQLVVVLAGMYHHRIDYPTAPPPPAAEGIAAAPADAAARGVVPTS
jgi:cyclic-di-AMP phosphodiesterase PgpH